MKTINITESGITNVFEKMSTEFGGRLELNSVKNSLTINSKLCRGIISGMELKNGVSYIEFDITVEDDIRLKINSPKQSVLNFVYCAKGKVGHKFGEYGKLNTVDTFQTGITSNITNSHNSIYLKKGIAINAILISVNTSYKSNFSNAVNETLFKLFIEDKTENFLHLGSYNLKISEIARQLKSLSQTGLARTLLTEGLINIMLGLEIEQHSKDQNKCHTGSLTNYELERIKDISEFINNYPEHSFKLSDLTRKAGIPQAKLQEGFKIMHDQTVNSYIRTVRITKSEQLMKTTDMNISEIVYSVGITSRSYFSKIFKKQYKVTPNDYRNKIQSAATA